MRPVHKGCDDFRQTSAAARDRWLVPRLSRRQAIGGGLGGALAIWAGRAMDFGGVIEAATAEAAAAPAGRVLVSVFLPGGADLLDTLPPVGQYGTYADLRPGTKLASPPLLGGTGLGIHPSLTEGIGGGVKGLFDAGKVGFLPGIDYANPDLSHFHSRHFWETGLISERAAPGWLGRWLDRHGSAENPLQGLTLGSTLSPVLATGKAPVAALESPRDVGLDVWGTEDKTRPRLLAAWEQLTHATRGGGDGPQSVRTAAVLAKRVGDRLAPYAEKDGKDPLAPVVAYPEDDGFSTRLSRLAALIAQPLGVRVAAVQADGEFDTHDNQPEDLARALRSVSQGLAAFQADLEARGVADRVMTLVWSEFGRRPKGNESAGSDHGAGGVAWVQGNHAVGGVLTVYPSLTALDRDDNLRVTVDFRKVYASLIEGWLGTGADEVIPRAGAYGRLSLVR
ncbi:DUF1501 domain-containing protein [Conexibacter sp. JD483]|uniref:DUF1501 domain-containing protein n=1 Tax=unclassified Conexibacter TaxID=2627773 RepID=UPI0027239653|nr:MULTISPECIES: DUF1501 domain-containing protein [unclassified Conexibacter]MDO8189386.1 DUF1501 domain-containing protein [Conexibacter sp. CPCC 205706]MDO8201093.1 DUF1501 domain-containing protein [Conexibacter sp. CPCC 205762]MDR9372445.1 DUF1501 domain-containing protein [Conexibacter sp. JD483]